MLQAALCMLYAALLIVLVLYSLGMSLSFQRKKRCDLVLVNDTEHLIDLLGCLNRKCIKKQRAEEDSL